MTSAAMPICPSHSEMKGAASTDVCSFVRTK